LTYLDQHLQGEDEREDVVGAQQEVPLRALRWDVGPFHGESDAVEADEEQNGVVEPFLLDEP
jgi:hypothetical protein